LIKEFWSHLVFFLGAFRKPSEVFKENSGQFFFFLSLISSKFSFWRRFLQIFQTHYIETKIPASQAPTQTYSGGQRIWEKIETYLKGKQRRRQPIVWRLIQNESVHVPLKFECKILEFEKRRVMILGTVAKNLKVTSSFKEKTWVMQA
jgi:hypothetical protein